MKSKFAWLVAPVVFAALLTALLVIWAVVNPETLVANFDADGRSPFELATLPVFAAIVPMVWICNPFGGSRARRNLLCAMVTVVALMAIVKELDLHYLALHWLYPDFVQETGGLVPGKLVKPSGSPLTGTPFKMRVLTNAAVPLGMKAAIVGYFAAFFGVFAAGFAYLGARWVKGVFRLEPAAWAWGCLGASGVMVQVADRLPAWLGHRFGLDKDAEGGASAASSLCTCLEEGGEMMLAIFALLTIFLAHRALKQET